MIKHRIWLLLFLPAFVAVAALTLFVVQGGFGGGHGDFDPAIGLLGLPSILLVEHLPIRGPDILTIVLFPAALNLIAWIVLVFVLRFLVRGRPNQLTRR